MKINKVVMFILLLLLISATLLVIKQQYCMKIPGKIFIANTLFEPSKKSSVRKEIYGNAVFSISNKNKMFSVGYDEIYSYDINTERKESIYFFGSDEYGNFTKPNYCDCNEMLYFADRKNSKICAIDVKEKEKMELDIMTGINCDIFSITKDGNFIFFTDDRKQIVKKNFKTGQNEIIAYGIDPILSDDDSLIAYRPTDKKNCIRVKSLNTDYFIDIEVPSNTIRHYVISPNKAFIAVLYGEGVHLDEIKLSVFDMQNGDFIKTIISGNKKLYAVRHFDWK